MLTDEQVDYLLELREAKPSLPEKTVRVILGALNWKSDAIDRGIAFLNQPKKEPTVQAEISQVAPKVVFPVSMPKVFNLPVSINIKQKPFPIHTPLIHGEKKLKVSKKGFFHGRTGILHGAVFGLVIFVGGFLLYVYISR